MDVVCRGGHHTIMKNRNQSDRPRVFLLSADGAISVFAAETNARGAMSDGDVIVDSAAELQRVASEWPSARLVAIWNSIPGKIPVRKFTDRSTGLNRIWQAIQSLKPAPPRLADVASSDRDTDGARPGTKKARLLALLARTEGVSVREIMAALGWQSHSVRGCLSTLSRQGAGISSFRRPDGERAYSTLPSPDSRTEVAP
jgi:hypothetical protein